MTNILQQMTVSASSLALTFAHALTDGLPFICFFISLQKETFHMSFTQTFSHFVFPLIT
jgi:hypothetical protein